MVYCILVAYCTPTYVCSKSVTTYSLTSDNVYIRTLYSMYALLYAYNIFIYIMYTLHLRFFSQLHMANTNQNIHTYVVYMLMLNQHT